MPRMRLSTSAFASAALAVGLAAQAPAQPSDWDAGIPWIDAGNVLESLPPGITSLGRTPPNELPGESTAELQRLIDEAHDAQAENAGDRRDAARTPPRIRPLD